MLGSTNTKSLKKDSEETLKPRPVPPKVEGHSVAPYIWSPCRCSIVARPLCRVFYDQAIRPASILRLNPAAPWYAIVHHRNRFCGLGGVSQTVFGTKIEIAFTKTGQVRRLLSCRTFWQHPVNETEAETVFNGGENLARETGSTQGTRKGPVDHKAS